MRRVLVVLALLLGAVLSPAAAAGAPQCITAPDGARAVRLWNQGEPSQATALALATLADRPFSGPAQHVLQRGLDAGHWLGVMWLDRIAAVAAWLALGLGMLLLAAAFLPRLAGLVPVIRYSLLGVLLGYALWAGFAAARDRAVVVEEVPLRILPEPGANAVARLAPGMVATVRDRQAPYLLIQHNAQSGWVDGAALVQVDRCFPAGR